MLITDEQMKQLNRQLKEHQHEDYEIDIVLDDQNTLKDFLVCSNVHRPDVITSYELARWIFNEMNVNKDECAIDMGCGTGMQGIILGLKGIKKIIFTDKSMAAVKNTKKNISKFKLNKISNVRQGNLFENVKEKADIIIFNHPFYSDHTVEELLGIKSVFHRGYLIHDFFKEAKNHLKKDGRIIMPYYIPAGEINDPGKQAGKHDYQIANKIVIKQKKGLQKGKVVIYEIKIS